MIKHALALAEKGKCGFVKFTGGSARCFSAQSAEKFRKKRFREVSKKRGNGLRNSVERIKIEGKRR